MTEETIVEKTCEQATTLYNEAPEATKATLKLAMDKACKSGADQETIRNSHSKKDPDYQFSPSMPNIV